MNKNKFAIIICIRNEQAYQECELYLGQLRVPEGYTLELVPIRGEKSMAAAYNSAMAATDAKYKIYLQEEVCIINPNILQDLLTVFALDERIGMVGVLGSEKMPCSGAMWQGERIGNLYALEPDNVDFTEYAYQPEDGYTEVEAIEGLLMATSVDIPWRADLFDGRNFYDCAQSFELRKQGYKLVVPEQLKPWIAHDGGILNIWNGYDEDRKVFIEHYLTESELNLL